MQSLFLLIHSLTPTEKRYFKLFAQRQVHTKNTNYANLFQAINEQETYDENALLKKFRKEKFVSQFAVAKNYLFNMILSCMQQYNEENYIEWKIRNMYLQCKILASKGLDVEAAKMITKTKALAWQYEMYYVLGDVIILQKYLHGNNRIGSPTIEYYSKIDAEEKEVLNILTIHQKVNSTWHYLTLLEFEVGITPQELICAKAEKYVQADYMAIEPPISLTAKYRFYATWSLYYTLIGDQQKFYDCCKKCVLMREEQMAQQPSLNLDPLAPYFNFLLSCEKADNWLDFEFYLNKIYNYKAHSIEVNIRRMHNYCWCGLMFYLYHKQYSKAYEIVEDYRQFFVEKNVVFRKDFKLYIETCCGLVCLFVKKYKEAAKWFNNIINTNNIQVELRSQANARLYLIMLHYDEGNFETIEYISRQTQKYLELKLFYHEPEMIFLKMINEASSINNKKYQKQILVNLHQQLSLFNLSITGNAINQFVINWIKEKL